MNPALRDRAKREIRAFLLTDPERINVVLRALQQATRYTRRMRWLTVLALIGIGLLYVGGKTHGKVVDIILALALLCQVCLNVFVLASKGHRLSAIFNVVAETEGKRFVGPLLQARQYHDLWPIATRMLIRLLPQLQRYDASLLNEVQRNLLNWSLQDSNPMYVIAALRALEQVGDSNALPFVTGVAESALGFSFRWGAQRGHLMQAALSCAHVLTQRVEWQQIS